MAETKTAPSKSKVVSLAQKMLGKLQADAGSWKELVAESAKTGVMPDAAVLRHISASLKMNPDDAPGLFEADVAALQSFNNQTRWHEQSRNNLQTLHNEHGTGKQLAEQVEVLAEELKQLRALTRRVYVAEDNNSISGYQLQALKGRHERIFN